MNGKCWGDSVLGAVRPKASMRVWRYVASVAWGMTE